MDPNIFLNPVPTDRIDRYRESSNYSLQMINFLMQGKILVDDGSRVENAGLFCYPREEQKEEERLSLFGLEFQPQWNVAFEAHSDTALLLENFWKNFIQHNKKNHIQNEDLATQQEKEFLQEFKRRKADGASTEKKPTSKESAPAYLPDKSINVQTEVAEKGFSKGLNIFLTIITLGSIYWFPKIIHSIRNWFHTKRVLPIPSASTQTSPTKSSKVNEIALKSLTNEQK